VGQWGHEGQADNRWRRADGSRRQSLVISLLFREIIVDGGFRPTTEMVIPDLQEGDSELVDTKGIDDGVHG
jgi:hypothetical protein